jgi:DNA gyrase subunit A
VKAVTLGSDKDEVIGMVCVENAQADILVVSDKGFGKRSSLEDYRITNRGGKGVKTMNMTDKTGELIAIQAVDTDHDFMIINKSGITIRLRVEDLRVMGRNTQGVKLINLRGSDEIAAVCTVERDEEEEIDPSAIVQDGETTGDVDQTDSDNSETEQNEE